MDNKTSVKEYLLAMEDPALDQFITENNPDFSWYAAEEKKKLSIKNKHGVQVEIIYDQGNRFRIKFEHGKYHFFIDTYGLTASYIKEHRTKLTKLLPDFDSVTPEFVKDNWDFVYRFESGHKETKDKPFFSVHWRTGDDRGKYYPDWHHDQNKMAYQISDGITPMKLLSLEQAEYMYRIVPWEYKIYYAYFNKLKTSRKYKDRYQEFLKRYGTI